MWSSSGKDSKTRLKDDYAVVFDSEQGRRVLMDLYDKCHMNSSTIPVDGNQYVAARNEGKRCTFLYIQGNVKEMDMSGLWVEHVAEKIREEQST